MAEQFDPLFFGISAAEAIDMDPHQKILLQVCFEALSQAGLTNPSDKENRVGVFVGFCNNEWIRFVDHNSLTAYSGTNTAQSSVANRLV